MFENLVHAGIDLQRRDVVHLPELHKTRQGGVRHKPGNVTQGEAFKVFPGTATDNGTPVDALRIAK